MVDNSTGNYIEGDNVYISDHPFKILTFNTNGTVGVISQSDGVQQNTEYTYSYDEDSGIWTGHIVLSSKQGDIISFSKQRSNGELKLDILYSIMNPEAGERDRIFSYYKKN